MQSESCKLIKELKALIQYLENSFTKLTKVKFTSVFVVQIVL